MSQEDTIEKIETGFREMALDGIKKASAGGSKMGAFILVSCFIDCMAGFVKGGKANTTKDDYKDFVKNYLPSYNKENMYHDLRCKLVHNYSEGGSYVFVADLSDLHQKPAKNGKSYINLEDFICDVEHAMKRLLREIKTINKMQTKAIDRFNQVGLLKKISIDKRTGSLVSMSFPATTRE